MTTTTMRQGLSLTGDFLSIKPGKAWTGKDGVTRNPAVVSLLVNDTAYKIEYRDEASAAAAVAGAGAGDRGDVVTLPVFARANGGRVYYSGLNQRAGE